MLLREFCPHCGARIPPIEGEGWGACCLPYQESYALREARKKAYRQALEDDIYGLKD